MQVHKLSASDTGLVAEFSAFVAFPEGAKSAGFVWTPGDDAAAMLTEAPKLTHTFPGPKRKGHLYLTVFDSLGGISSLAEVGAFAERQPARRYQITVWSNSETGFGADADRSKTGVWSNVPPGGGTGGVVQSVKRPTSTFLLGLFKAGLNTLPCVCST